MLSHLAGSIVLMESCCCCCLMSCSRCRMSASKALILPSSRSRSASLAMASAFVTCDSYCSSRALASSVRLHSCASAQHQRQKPRRLSASLMSCCSSFSRALAVCSSAAGTPTSAAFRTAVASFSLASRRASGLLVSTASDSVRARCTSITHRSFQTSPPPVMVWPMKECTESQMLVRAAPAAATGCVRPVSSAAKLSALVLAVAEPRTAR
mmetsp:Transcript_70105/g.226870  ORF Transcript_70105/g.226870 Transcript_70105/m.226870 type:complete len:211 (-) Transcript_70105:475-1107(-)